MLVPVTGVTLSRFVKYRFCFASSAADIAEYLFLAQVYWIVVLFWYFGSILLVVYLVSRVRIIFDSSV